MTQSTEDLALLTLQEVAQLQLENRKRGQELRQAASALVDQRLAKQISLEDYLARRQRGREDQAEWRRREEILEAALLGRGLPGSAGYGRLPNVGYRFAGRRGREPE
jgi:type II secretory pathway component HofQ